MLEGADFRHLARWCRQRRMQVQDAGAVRGAAAMRLVPDAGPAAFGPMFLVAEPGEYRLLDGQGEPLAAASDLPAVLDAVDGGVASPRRGELRN